MENPLESVDEFGYGTRKRKGKVVEASGLRAEELAFVARSENFSTIGGEKGREWDDE